MRNNTVALSPFLACMLSTAIIFLIIVPQTALAGSSYSGWGNDPEEAMQNALARAISVSPGGCACKDWAQDIEDHCAPSTKLGGFTCYACGSNHKGSCESQAEIDRLVRDAGKWRKLLGL